jgi:hypothetical protein
MEATEKSQILVGCCQSPHDVRGFLVIFLSLEVFLLIEISGNRSINI